jgi:sucrose-phosphate synthase
MHIIFLNPQGNFDEHDSHMTEHPDFGGQLIYVKEVCMALSKMGIKVDILTRRIEDPEWPEFSKEIDYYEGYEENLRIVRLEAGGLRFLPKELLWEHMDEWTDNILSFYGDSLPAFSTSHYGDGGYAAVLLKKKAGIGFTFTGHSLGAQKLDKLGTTTDNVDEMEERYRFSKRITAERLSMEYAQRIITSTSQERFGQYTHKLYHGAVDANDDSKFSIIPPGVNTRLFNKEAAAEDAAIEKYIEKIIRGNKRPFVIVSSRLDEKKNHIGVVRAYTGSRALQEKAGLGLFIRGIDDPYSEVGKLSDEEQQILKPILELINQHGVRDKVSFFNLKSQGELAAAYRYFGRLGSVFALTAFYEPFGLAPIEAAACGLAVAATKNGGPTEIFEDGSGVLVDPFDDMNIAEGLLKGVNEYEHYSGLGEKRVREKYTWEKTAASYLSVIEEGAGKTHGRDFTVHELDATERIRKYLIEKTA